jgi:hypothetical protein
MALPYKPVVKNGKFYHVYGDGSNASDWRYIRPAGQTPTAQVTPSASVSAPSAGPSQPAPIAPPPSLTPDDLASQAVEEADWQRYFSGIENQTRQMEIDSGTAIAANQQQHGENLSNNQWNAAARGLGNSSIKQQDQAKIVQAFERNQANITDKLNAQKAYTSNERNNYNTNVQPKIAAKWAAKARQNAEEAHARQLAAWSASQSGGAAPAPAAAARPTAAQAGYRNVVKGGKFYHVYGSGSSERWVYIRPAS